MGCRDIRLHRSVDMFLLQSDLPGTYNDMSDMVL